VLAQRVCGRRKGGIVAIWSALRMLRDESPGLFKNNGFKVFLNASEEGGCADFPVLARERVPADARAALVFEAGMEHEEGTTIVVARKGCGRFRMDVTGREAHSGNDHIKGEQGRDYIDGGEGDDCIHGNSGRDTIYGGDGNDTMFGNGSMDTMDGGRGNDAMSGGARDDVMTGGEGYDCMKGDGGDDYLNGGADNDTMLGDDGSDILVGEGGDDQLDGGDGLDALDAGAGNDLLTGGKGNDDLTGGAGSDTFAFRQDEVQGNTDLDIITDWNPFDSNEKILLCGQIDPFFTVEKIEIGIYDNFANLTRDVRIGLSNGQFILLLDVGDSGDFVADDVDPENNAAHADDFIRAASCEIDCTVDCDNNFV